MWVSCEIGSTSVAAVSGRLMDGQWSGCSFVIALVIVIEHPVAAVADRAVIGVQDGRAYYIWQGHREVGRQAGRMSWLTTLLVSLLSLGAGVMGGYGALYLRYNSECRMLLQNAKARAAEASKSLETQYKHLKDAYDECIQGESEFQRKCNDQQSLALGAHSSLAMKHQALLEEHAEGLEKITKLQKENDSQLQLIQSLRQQVKQHQLESQQQQQQQQQQTSETCSSGSPHLVDQLALKESLLQDKMREIQSLKEAQLNHSGSTFPSSQQIVSTLKASIQRQQWAQTLLQYQTRGPFRVEFTLDVSHHYHHQSTSLGGGGSSSSSSRPPLQTFVVELAEFYSMTLATFLKLAEAGLYVGTTIRYMDNAAALVGGHPQHAASKRTQSNLSRRLAEHGYGMTPFLWVEHQQQAQRQEQRQQTLAQSQSSSSSSTTSSSGDPFAVCTNRPGAFWFPTQGQQFQITLPATASLAAEMDDAKWGFFPDHEKDAAMVLSGGGGEACHGRIFDGLYMLYQVFGSSILEDEENRPRITIANTRVLVPADPQTAHHHHDDVYYHHQRNKHTQTIRDEM